MKIKIHVKPRSSREGVDENPDGTFVVRVNAPPVEGKANERVVEMLADHFGVPKRRIRIAVGARGRTKLVEIV